MQYGAGLNSGMAKYGGMADARPDGFPWLTIFSPQIALYKALWDRYVGPEYSQANASIEHIRTYLNDYNGRDNQAPYYRDHVGHCSDWWLFNSGSGCFSRDEVESIVVCYDNLVTQGTIPEFYYKLPESTRDAMCEKIAVCSGSDHFRVNEVLDAMHTLYYEGKVFAMVAYPLAFAAYKDQRTTPEDYDTITNGLKLGAGNVVSAVEDTLNVLKWVAIAAAGGFALYYGYQFIKVAKEA